MTKDSFNLLIEKYRSLLHPVVQAAKEVLPLDLSEKNVGFTSEIFNDIKLFNAFIDASSAPGSFLIGGYAEDRKMYTRSGLFVADTEPRSIHLGIDVWGPAGTPITSPLNGVVHSFKFNDAHGDYGATIIVTYELEEEMFHVLYGHLSARDLDGLSNGKKIAKGEAFAHFGPPSENGNWPPHLHFQIILEMGDWYGDYPGVCKKSEVEKYLANSPDPATMLQLGFI